MLCNSYDACHSSLLYQNGCGLKSILLNVVGLNVSIYDTNVHLSGNKMVVRV